MGVTVCAAWTSTTTLINNTELKAIADRLVAGTTKNNDGGIIGPAWRLHLSLVGSSDSIPLAGDWKCKIELRLETYETYLSRALGR